MVESGVIFKATLNGLVIILKEGEAFDSIYSQIEKKVAHAGRFFKGSSIAIKYRGKKLSKNEQDKILQLLKTKSGAEITSIEEEDEMEVEVQENYPKNQNRLKMKNFYFKGINEGASKFYRGTLRSGQLVSFDGNLVVIGDVNPGGEVVATGNVIVMGSLRGMVHAGADGNKEAIVVAFNLRPMQLRIADIITRSPDGNDNNGTYIPELAYVKENAVYIERFLPQYK